MSCFSDLLDQAAIQPPCRRRRARQQLVSRRSGLCPYRRAHCAGAHQAHLDALWQIRARCDAFRRPPGMWVRLLCMHSRCQASSTRCSPGFCSSPQAQSAVSSRFTNTYAIVICKVPGRPARGAGSRTAPPRQTCCRRTVKTSAAPPCRSAILRNHMRRCQKV